MKLDLIQVLVICALALFIGVLLGSRRRIEAFEDATCLDPKEGKIVPDVSADADASRQSVSCPACRPSLPCPEPDASKWVLKATVPPCPAMPDMSKYMLKTECPPQPDMSKYVLKSSVPKCPPCISTCSKPCKIGECPPCPRPRCPTIECPAPKACPACPTSVCQACPEPDIQVKAVYKPQSSVRPMLASTSAFGL